MSAEPLFSLREATLKDIPAIKALSYELFVDPTSIDDQLLDSAWAHDERGESYFRTWIEKAENIFLLAESSDQPVGFLSGGRAEYENWRPVIRYELFNLYVKPEFRSHGVGKVLCEHFKKWCEQQGAELLSVKAYADNERGIAFYKKMGFKPYSLELEMKLKSAKKDTSDGTVVA